MFVRVFLFEFWYFGGMIENFCMCEMCFVIVFVLFCLGVIC